MSKKAVLPLFVAKVSTEVVYSDGNTITDTYFPHPFVFPDEKTAIALFLEGVKDSADTKLHGVWQIGTYSPIDGSIKIYKQRKKVYPHEDEKETQ